MTPERVETAAEMYQHYRVLNSDDPVEVGVKSVLGGKGRYYLHLTSDDQESIPLYLAIPDINVPHQMLMLFDDLSGEGEPTVSNIKKNGVVSLNPTIERELSKTSDSIENVETYIGGEEYSLKLFLSPPPDCYELDEDEAATLRWDANVSTWYFNNKRENQDVVETQLGDIVGSINETDVVYQIPLGSETTTVTIPVPPHGTHPEQVSKFIEVCGGHIPQLTGSTIVLELHGHKRPLTTHHDVFGVTTPEQFDAELKNKKLNKIRTPITVVLAMMLTAILVVTYITLVGWSESYVTTQVPREFETLALLATRGVAMLPLALFGRKVVETFVEIFRRKYEEV